MVGDDFATASGRAVIIDAARGTGARRGPVRAPSIEGALTAVSDQQMSGGVTTYYVKIVNPFTQLQAARISFTGVTSIDKTATQTVLTGNPGTRNTLAARNAIVPRASSVTVANGQRFAFPASSVTILQITAK